MTPAECVANLAAAPVLGLLEALRVRAAANAAPPPREEGPEAAGNADNLPLESNLHQIKTRSATPLAEGPEAVAIPIPIPSTPAEATVEPAEAAEVGELFRSDSVNPPPKRTKTRGGRPLRLTPKIAFRLGKAVGRGRCWTEIARKAGIGKSTLYRWYRLGESGDARFAWMVRDLKAVRESHAFWSVNCRVNGSVFDRLKVPEFGTEGPAALRPNASEDAGDVPETPPEGGGCCEKSTLSKFTANRSQSGPKPPPSVLGNSIHIISTDVESNHLD